MKHKMIVLLTVIAFAASPSSGQQVAKVSPLPELLENAIFTEETVGDLDAAIEMYLSILEQAEADRAFVAQAQFRLGLCYLKKGNEDEAVAALRKLVADFPTQQELVAQANDRLSELGFPSPAAGMVARRVWGGPGVDFLGAPSPDGRHVTFVDWETGDLAIHDLTSGDKRRLTNKGGWSESKEYAEYSTVSPSGKQVAYVWFNKELSHDLRLIGIDGSAPRVLYRQDEPGHIQPHAWSPDGKHILCLLHRTDAKNRIVLVSVADGSVRVLKILDHRYPVKMSLSPDGRFVAYDFPPEAESPERDIFLLATEGGQEIPLVQHPASDLFPLWAPDGSRILFASDRTGAMGLWAIQIADGQPRGAPELIKPDLGRMFPMGLTKSGLYFYALFTGVRDVYTATLDAETGAVVAPASPVTERFVGRKAAPGWSPDGRYLAYVSRRGPVPNIPLLIDELGSSIISIRSVDTGEERELAPRISGSLGLEIRWHPDGSALVVVGNDEKGRPGFYSVDPESGDVTTILQGEVEGLLQSPRFSSNGRDLFYVRGDSDGFRILARNLETEQEKELYRTPVSPVTLALSPDDQSLAFAYQDPARGSDVLMIVPASGGEPEELYQGDGIFAWVGILEWTPDGSHLVFAKSRFPEAQVELWRIPADGGDPERFGMAMDHMRGLSLHPDGRQIAFTAGDSRAEVWVMENFLPELKGDAVSEVRR